MDVTGRSASKIHCPNYRFQPSTTLGGGVKRAVCVFFVSIGEKKLVPLRLKFNTIIVGLIWAYWGLFGLIGAYWGLFGLIGAYLGLIGAYLGGLFGLI